VYSAPRGKKYFPRNKNIGEFEVKNRRKSAEEAKAENLLLLKLFFFDSNKTRLALKL